MIKKMRIDDVHMISDLLETYGDSSIMLILQSLVENGKSEILFSMSKYLNYEYSEIEPNYHDYQILNILVNVLKVKYKELFYLKSVVSYSEIREVCIRYKENTFAEYKEGIDYFLIVHRSKSSTRLDFDHVSVYNRILDEVYDIQLPGTYMYMMNTSCAINSLCYILACEGKFQNVYDILLLFTLFHKVPSLVDMLYNKLN